MSKHTQGPWSVVGNRIVGGDTGTENYGQIASIDTDWRGDIVAGNARLIAAAPALAEALRIAYLAFAHDEEGPVWSDSLIAKTRAALEAAGVEL
jgi:hypothetical protein